MAQRKFTKHFPAYRGRRVNAYLQEVANELLPEALAEAQANIAKLAA